MNPVLDRITPSLIRALNARKRPGDVDLGLGEPVLRPDVGPFEAALERVRREGTPYSPNGGFPELRQAVARYHGFPERGDAAHVCTTVGSEEALFVSIKITVDPARDEVLIVEPCFLAYPKMCTLEGIRHRGVSLSPDDGFAPRAAPVLEAVGPDTRLIVINSPCNPTARVWPEAELRALAEGLSARPGSPVYVLVDEVYRELYYTPEPPVSLATFYPHTLTVGSLSKSNALTGMRLGWLIADAPIIASAIKVHGLVNTATSTFSQWVAMETFATPGSLSAHRPIYAGRHRALVAAAERHGLDMAPPEGAFYAFLRLPPALASNSMAAAERLLEEHRVVAVPGIAFGPSAEGWLRISWVPDEATLAEGLARIAEFFNS
ncbi:MAG: Aspartate aminotransferase [uncultured Gemmatimonadetes bacterium]|uniref:Aminotransferase n=1 Tax=uncultured Gemmatimonadota bacterium TaxID=203437 RepID=A0A6J4LGY5_9BACT|nr:MAG: Aspartate aminotransferase [uncultured Gemmatimonadota bacterium]